MIENKTKTAGAYSQALALEWAAALQAVAPSGAFGSRSSVSHELESVLLHISSEQSLVGKTRKTASSKWTFSSSEAGAVLSSGVVFGQHNTTQASRTCGQFFKAFYPC